MASTRLLREPSAKEITDLDLAILVGATRPVVIGGLTMHVEGAQDPKQPKLLARMDGNGYGVPQGIRDILMGIGYSCHYSPVDKGWEIHWNRDPTVSGQSMLYYFLGRNHR